MDPESHLDTLHTVFIMYPVTHMLIAKDNN